MTQFVSLHVHTHFSLLDGLSSPKSLVTRAKELGHSAIAISDHGVMHGAIELYREALKEGIKPIIGVEAYLKDQSSTDRLKEFVATGDGDYKVKGLFHQLILAMNPQGYKNLCKLTSRAHLSPDRGNKLNKQSKSDTSTRSKSWCYFEELQEFNEGLIVTSGCMAGIIPQSIMAGDYEYAEEVARKYQSIFGDRFYIEIQDHSLGDEADHESAWLNVFLVSLAEKLNVEVVATADNHYTIAAQKSAHDALLCINTGKLLSDEKRMRYEGAYWLPSGDEMVERLSRYLPIQTALRAVENTVRLAARIEDYQLKGTPTPPKFTLPSDFDNADDYLEELAYEGLRKRFYGVPPQNYSEQLQYELDIFKQKNLGEYFLVVGDICRFCREQGILLGPGRGSAAGSLVAYSLQITNIDPIHFGLIFSRFLNPERMSYPDIDLDIDKERRHEVIEYLQQKYGSSQVAQIATFNKMVSALAFKDTGRVFGDFYAYANTITKKIPVVRGKPAKLSVMVQDGTIYPEFYKAYQDNKEISDKDGNTITFKEWADLAVAVEGTVKTIGVHAAGVVIGWTSLDEIVPLMRSKEGATVTQYSMEDLEFLGLLKMDLLGLKTLSVIGRTVEAVKRLKGELINLESINLNDHHVIRSMITGDCAGIFQFEADNAVRLLREIKPTSIDDVSAITSLNRPGCLDMGMHKDYARRKAGLDKTTFLTPALEPIMSSTFGLCVFQEQMLRVFNEIAGFSLGKSDNARRACISGDTFIILDNGQRLTVREYARLFEALKPSSIQCLDVEKYKATKGEVLDAFYNGHQKVYEIKTKTGRKIKATSNHQFFKLKQWISIDEGLSVGDSIAVPTELHTNNDSHSEMSLELIKMCAYMIGDGHINPNGRLGYFCNTEQWLLDDFSKCCLKEFGYLPRQKYQQAEHQPNPVGYVYLEKESMVTIVRKIGIGLSGDRFVPDWVWQLNRNELRVFLAALWCTDGGFSENNVGEYCSVSERLIETLQEVFLMLGIVTTTNKKTHKYKGEDYVSYRLWVSGQEDVIKFYHELRAFMSPEKQQQLDASYAHMTKAPQSSGKYTVPSEVMHLIKSLNPLSKSWRSIGIESGLGKDLSSGVNFTNIKKTQRMARHRVRRFGDALKSQELINIGSSDILWDQIASITYVGIEDVYDLTVAEHHNFVANGFYLHNCGKKKAKEMEVLEPDFINGCSDNWIDEPIARQLWEIMLASAEYTFNSSHAYCYSVITLFTAWLKYYYRCEFMTALCSMEENKKKKSKYDEDEDESKLVDYLVKCKAYKIKLLPPDINKSTADFVAIDDSTIRWGLRAIKGLGNAAINPILLERSLSPFKDYLDFCQRTNLGSDSMTALIKAGALDCLHPNRAEMLAYLEPLKKWRTAFKARETRKLKWEREGLELLAINVDVLDSKARAEHEKRFKQVEDNLLRAITADVQLPAIPTKKDLTHKQRLEGEKEVLGLYSSGHPLDQYPVGCEPFENVEKGKVFVSTIQVNSARMAKQKNGDDMMFVTIEDKLGATFDLTVFSKQYVVYGHLFTEGSHVSIHAKGNEWKGKVNLILETALIPTLLQEAIVGDWEDDEF